MFSCTTQVSFRPIESRLSADNFRRSVPSGWGGHIQIFDLMSVMAECGTWLDAHQAKYAKCPASIGNLLLPILRTPMCLCTCLHLYASSVSCGHICLRACGTWLSCNEHIVDMYTYIGTRPGLFLLLLLYINKIHTPVPWTQVM